MDNVNNNVRMPTQMPTVNPGMVETPISETIEEIQPILADGINVISDTGRTRAVEGDKKIVDLQELPDLDEPDASLLKNIVQDLESVIALLQAEQDEKSLESMKQRLESLKSQIEQHHTDTLNKVNKSIDEMSKQEKAAKVNKILGWLGVAVSLIVAAAMVLTVGGAAAGFAVAGAVLGAAMQTLNETGAMEKMVKNLAESLHETFPSLDRDTCNAIAQVAVAALTIGISIALAICSGGASAGNGLLNVTQATQKTVQTAMMIANLAMSSLNLISSGVSSVVNYDAQKAQADVTEMQKFLTELNTLIEQENKDIEELLAKLQDVFANIVDLLQSKQDVLNDINFHIGA